MNKSLLRKEFSKVCIRLWEMEARMRNMVDSGDEVEEARYNAMNKDADAMARDLGLPLRDRWDI